MAENVLTKLAAAVLALPLIAAMAWGDADDALRDALVHIAHDQKLMLTSPLRVNRVDVIIWGTAAGSLLYLAPKWGAHHSADERLEQGIHRNDASSPFLRNFTHVGDAPVLIGVSLTGYGLGRWQDWPLVRRGSLHVFEGLIDAGIAAEVFKILAGRRRPVDRPSRGPFLGPGGFFGDSENDSFPSGHAALTFATATIISHESQSYWVGVPAYIVAGGISYSRIYVEKHWLSDVIGGATLGYSVGILVEHQRHSKPQLAGHFYPYANEGAFGIAWMRSF